MTQNKSSNLRCTKSNRIHHSPIATNGDDGYGERSLYRRTHSPSPLTCFEGWRPTGC